MELKLSFLILILGSFSYNCEAGRFTQNFLTRLKNKDDKTDVIVEFSPILDQVSSHPSLTTLSIHDQRSKIVNLAKKFSAAAQLPVMNALSTLGLSDQSTPFWLANKISIKNVSLSSIKALAAIPGLFTIREPFTVNVFPIHESKQPLNGNGPILNSNLQQNGQTNPQWGVAKINAPIAHANGINGTGIIVGIIDSGVSPTHEALKLNYKNDQWSWKDVINSRLTPYDDYGHGTHCMGTILGTANGIGVAPGAKWIACKGLNSGGGGTEAHLLACGEFMACPNNSSGTCTDLPNIVSNSWGGGYDNTFFNNEILMWKKLGIIPVFSIGNNGPQCGTAHSPGDQPNVISVGSTEPDDTISDFSSRGPGGPVDHEEDEFVVRFYNLTIKPEVSAPGRNITSADAKNDTGYIVFSATSFAAPHVAGAAALILSTDKTLSFDEVMARLENTAVKLKATTQCPCWKVLNQPNNHFGHGRIDCKAALGL